MAFSFSFSKCVCVCVLRGVLSYLMRGAVIVLTRCQFQRTQGESSCNARSWSSGKCGHTCIN